MEGASAELRERRDKGEDMFYVGKQIIKETMDVKIDLIGLKYMRASAAIRNFLRFYGFINYIKYDGTPECFQLLV